MRTRPLSWLIPLCLVAGCSQSQRPVQQVSKAPEPTQQDKEQDSAPLIPRANLDSIPNAVPKWEAKSRYGNPESYEVFGIRYHVQDSNQNFTQQGLASWYGTKFHGRRTSSGEPYDMYAMTAAHKTLPLPTYVKVNNLENGKSIIVKVNDRGPFHEGRIIDLSYTAAHQLGVLDKGTAKVSISTITPPPPNQQVAKKTTRIRTQPGTLQLGAFQARHNAEAMQKRLKTHTKLGNIVIAQRKADPKKLYRVQLSSTDSTDLRNTQKQLALEGIPSQLIIPSSAIE